MRSARQFALAAIGWTAFSLAARAETRGDAFIYTDTDEPAWTPTAQGPLSSWVDERVLAYPDERFRALAWRVREGQASKPMLREFYDRYRLLYPFTTVPPAGWRPSALRQAGRERSLPRGSELLGAPWSSTGPSNVGGRVSAIAAHPSDPDVAWVAAAGGGVWRWSYDPTGATWSWTPLFDDQPTMSIGSLAVDPLDPNKIYVGTGEQNYSLDEYDGVGVIRSLDGGASWLAPVSVGGAGRIGQLAIHPQSTNVVFAATRRGLFRSTDSGGSWALVLDGGSSDDVVIDPADPSVVYAVAQGNATTPWGIYRSTSGGGPGSFVQLSGSGACSLPAPGNGFRLELAISASSPNVLYAAFEIGSGEVWKTTDSGATWCRMTTPGGFCGGQCWYDMVLGVAPWDPDVVIAGGVSVYRSSDGASTWNQIPGIHVDHHAVAFLPGPGRVALDGNDGGVYRLDLSAGTPLVRNMQAGFVTAQYYGMAADPVDAARIYGGSQDNGTHRFGLPATTVAGVQLLVCGDGGHIRVHPTRNQRIFHTVCPIRRNLEFLVSDDAGASVARAVTGITVSEDANWAPPVELASASTIYTATARRVYRSTNADVADPAQIRWSPLGTQLLTASNGSISTVAATAADPDRVWAGTSTGDVWLTTDGSNWNEVFRSVTLRTRYVGEVVASPSDPLTAWVALGGYGSYDSGGHVFETTSGGASWSDMSGNLPNVPVNAILPHPGDPDRFWAGTWLGVFETIDHGANWALEASVPRVAIADMVYDLPSRKVHAASHGRGIWSFDDAPVTGGPPRPVPDGVVDRGQPVWAARAPGGQIRVSWGASSCPGNQDFNLFWAPLSARATFAYSASSCALGTLGVTTLTPPAGDVYFLMAGMNAAGEESGHRRRDGGAGWEPASGLGLCPVLTGRDLSQSCP